MNKSRLPLQVLRYKQIEAAAAVAQSHPNRGCRCNCSVTTIKRASTMIAVQSSSMKDTVCLLVRDKGDKKGRGASRTEIKDACF